MIDYVIEAVGFVKAFRICFHCEQSLVDFYRISIKFPIPSVLELWADPYIHSCFPKYQPGEKRYRARLTN